MFVCNIPKKEYDKLSNEQRVKLRQQYNQINIYPLTRKQVEWLTGPDEVLLKMVKQGRANRERILAEHGTLIGVLAHRRHKGNR